MSEVYYYKQIAEGNKYELGSLGEAAVSESIPVGGLVETQVMFSSRFEGFETYAVILNNQLSDTEMKRWPGFYQLVYVDPYLPIWYIRYVRNPAWLAYVAAIFVAMAVVWAAFVLWKVFEAFATFLKKYPWLVPVGVVGIVGIGLLNAVGGLTAPRPKHVQTTYVADSKAGEKAVY